MDGAAAHPLLALEDQPGEAAGSAEAAPKAKTAKSKAKSANPQEKQEALVDGTKAYTERQGKWRTDSALAVCDNIFVSVIADLCYRSSEPPHHFFHWLQAPTQPREMDGDLRHPTKLADIVYFKAEEIRADLESLTESRRWVSTLGKVDPELRRPLSECILTLTLLHLADFDKRIVHTFLDLDPIRLLTFSKLGAHIRDQGPNVQAALRGGYWVQMRPKNMPRDVIEAIIAHGNANNRGVQHTLPGCQTPDEERFAYKG